ncbi:MAG: dTMP kinase, partial [Tyzzerella sp.]|nr:dTMP kinase [Candidatus Fimicola merdigallinarum]
MKGLFITIEGTDGAGKSTQIELLKKYLEDRGKDVLVTREPGGTPISEKIRDIILDRENSEMSSITEALLYASSRAQHVSEKIKPALAEGKIVICDRFVDSSIAYQSVARGLSTKLIEDINKYAVDGLTPDITLYLSLIHISEPTRHT